VIKFSVSDFFLELAEFPVSATLQFTTKNCHHHSINYSVSLINKKCSPIFSDFDIINSWPAQSNVVLAKGI
jgi:hypothetical protein